MGNEMKLGRDIQEQERTPHTHTHTHTHTQNIQIHPQEAFLGSTGNYRDGGTLCLGILPGQYTQIIGHRILFNEKMSIHRFH